MKLKETCAIKSSTTRRDVSFTLRLLLLPLIVGLSTASKKSEKSGELFLDLSYKHNLDANILATVIEENIWVLDDETNSPEIVEVDVSSSIRGGKAMKQIISSLLPTNSNKSEQDGDSIKSSSLTSGVTTTTTIRLTARMNSLEPEAMTDLFNVILFEDEKQKSPDNQKISTTTEEQGKEAASKGNETSSLSEQNDDNDESPQQQQQEEHCHPWIVGSLDLGWNDVDPESSGTKAFFKALRRLVGNSKKCPKTLRLDRCGLGPAACRAIGKGIMARYEQESTTKEDTTLEANNNKNNQNNELLLHLGGNHGVGDSGAAALAAAIRTAVSTSNTNDEENENCVILDTLDLSACNIGDAGAEALAMAIESAPPGFCLRHLDLSNNRITDIGAAAIGRSLLSAANNVVPPKTKKAETTTAATDDHYYPALQSIDLSNNADIGDQGASAIATAIEKGMVQDVSIRSCNIRSDGASSFGKALQRLVQQQKSNKQQQVIRLDLSGNPLGVLRGKSKSHGGKYSASKLKSKASATITSNMNFIGKKLRSGLKDVTGVDVSAAMFGNSLESDDEEDELMGGIGGGGGDNNGDVLGADDIVDPSKARCGIKAFANAFLDDTADDNEPSSDQKDGNEKKRGILLRCELGMRRCFLDHGAADALAAVIVSGREETSGIEFAIDTTLNTVLEEDMVEALRGEEDAYYEHEDLLKDMAERHMDIMETVRIAQQRAREAAEAAAARRQSEQEMNAGPWVYDDNDSDGKEEYDIDLFDNYDVDKEKDESYSDGFKTGWDSDGDYEDEY